MPYYTVTGLIQSRDIDNNQPVSVHWYGGRDLAKAMAALVSCAANSVPDEDNHLPLSVQYLTLDVNLAIDHCVWETNQYQPWARVPCTGQVQMTTRSDQTGLLCEGHITAWDTFAEGEYATAYNCLPHAVGGGCDGLPLDQTTCPDKAGHM